MKVGVVRVVAAAVVVAVVVVVVVVSSRSRLGNSRVATTRSQGCVPVHPFSPGLKKTPFKFGSQHH